MSTPNQVEEKKSWVPSLWLVVVFACIVGLGGAGVFMNHWLVSLDSRVGNTEINIAQLQSGVEKAQTTADSAHARLTKRAVNLDNPRYKAMLADIRQWNPASDLCKLSDAAVEKLLNDGIWNVEPKIQAEHGRLVADRQNKSRLAADVAQVVAADAAKNAGVAQKTADKALAGSQVAIGGLQKIAEQRTGFLGKSVKTATKKDIAADIAKHRRDHGENE